MAATEGGMESRGPLPVPKLPPSTITVRGGLVVEFHEWTLWDETPWETLVIQRNPNGTFICKQSTPKSAWPSRTGTLADVLYCDSLHPSIARVYHRLFSTEGVTDEAIQRLFPRHQIIHQ